MNRNKIVVFITLILLTACEPQELVSETAPQSTSTSIPSLIRTATSQPELDDKAVDEVTLPPLDESETSWIQTNGPYGGLINTIAVDPNDRNIAYVGTFRWGTDFGNGVYKTVDGGLNWRDSNGTDDVLNGKQINLILIEPGNSQVVYTVGFNSGVYKSVDAGENWEHIFDAPSFSLAIAKSVPQILYSAVYVYGENRIKVYKSEDGGASWRLAGSPQGSQRGCIQCRKTSIAVDPSEPNTIYVGTFEGIYKSTDGGTSWIAVNEGLSRLDAVSIAIDPNDPNTLYALTGQFDIEACLERPNGYNPSFCGGVYKSINGGENWEESFTGLFDPLGHDLAISPTDSNVIYAAISHNLYRSSNAGKSWSLVYGISHESRRLIGTGDNVASVAPRDNLEVYAGLFGGVIKSSNGGAQWDWKTDGIRSHQIFSMEIDPGDPNVIYAGSLAGGGIYKTINGGRTWDNKVRGLVNSYIMQIAIDPINTNRVYATTNIGLYRSLTGGDTWIHVPPEDFGFGNRHTHLHGIAIDPNDPLTIYIGGGGNKYAPKGAGIYKSTDGGITWVRKNNGFTPDLHVSWVVIDPSNSQIVYVATQGWVEQWERTGSGSGIYKSYNGGESWSKINTGISLYEISALAIDVNNPQILYAGDEIGRIYKTSNGGEWWSQIAKLDAEIGRLVVDTKNPDVIYAASGKYKVDRGSLGSGVWQSLDGGQNWGEFNLGLFPSQVFNVALHSDTGILFAATGGSGVFKYGIGPPVAPSMP